MTVVVDHAFMLVASWMNCLLPGVAVIFALDVLCSGAICTQVYSSVLMPPCDAFLFTDAYLRTLSVITFTTNTTAALAQSFMCLLYFNLTKNRRFSAFLVFTVALHLSFSYTSAVMLNFVKLEADKIVLTAWIAFFSCAATDTMIAVALLSTFIRMNTATAMRDSTHSLLRRLMVLFFTSGVAVASTTLLTLILGIKESPATYLFGFAQGRVYALTILGNFVMGVAAQDAVTTLSVPTATITGVLFHVAYDGGVDSGVVMDVTVGENTLSCENAQ